MPWAVVIPVCKRRKRNLSSKPLGTHFRTVVPSLLLLLHRAGIAYPVKGTNWTTGVRVLIGATTTSGPPLRLTHPHIQWVLGILSCGSEAARSWSWLLISLSVSDVYNAWRFTSTPLIHPYGLVFRDVGKFIKNLGLATLDMNLSFSWTCSQTAAEQQNRREQLSESGVRKGWAKVRCVHYMSNSSLIRVCVDVVMTAVRGYWYLLNIQ
jgi:hypothetical protein